MGMFDTVDVHVPLPKCPKYAKDWQTKSLGCLMDHYIVKSDGTLWKSTDYWADDPNSKPVQLKDFTGSLEIGCLCVRGRKMIFIDYVLLFLDGKFLAARLTGKETRNVEVSAQHGRRSPRG